MYVYFTLVIAFGRELGTGDWRRSTRFLVHSLKKTADTSRRHHLFPRKMTSEKRAQKFHTDDVSLHTSGWCFWLVEANFPRGTTNQKHYQISVVTRHQYGISGVVPQTLGAIHSTKIPTAPTGKSGPPQKVDQFFRHFSGWTEAIHWALDGNFRKFRLNGSRLSFRREARGGVAKCQLFSQAFLFMFWLKRKNINETKWWLQSVSYQHTIEIPLFDFAAVKSCLTGINWILENCYVAIALHELNTSFESVPLPLCLITGWFHFFWWLTGILPFYFDSNDVINSVYR